MDATPKTQDSLQEERNHLLQELRKRMEAASFERDLRIFLKIPEKTYRSFLNGKFEMMNLVMIKEEKEHGFREELKKFLKFQDDTEKLGEEELAASRKRTSQRVREALEKKGHHNPGESEKRERLQPDPELMKKKNLIDDLLTHGHDLSCNGYFQILVSIKEFRKTRRGGFLGFLKKEKKNEGPIKPHEVIEHLWKSSCKKKRSSLPLEKIREKLTRVGIQCEPFDPKTPEAFEVGFLLTSDGYGIMIDLRTFIVSYDPVKPSL